MCGIVVLVAPRSGSAERSALAAAMAGRLLHRGPDAGGVRDDPASGVALAHRRLSILDLSPAGAQPKASADGRWLLTFNGEIYNHQDLRARLAGVVWRGHSDTETLVEACAAWGVAETVGRCRGMFAFAILDRERRRLWLARDRLGEKPLYYGLRDGCFAAASELPALREAPAMQGPPARAAAAAFLHHGRFPGTLTAWEDLHRLPPGGMLELDLASGLPATLPPSSAWYDLAAVAAAGQADPLGGDAEEASRLVEAELRRAVGEQMMADVPLGAFLSGGIDSSLIVALMQAQAGRPVRTFTIGFVDAAYDESRDAAAVAAHLGTEHTGVILGGDAARALVPGLPGIYGEPFADWSALPTALLCAETRRHVTVALSGDGGDELFAGYDRYVRALPALQRLRRLPRGFRALAGAAVGALPGVAWDACERAGNLLLPRGRRLRQLRSRAGRFAGILAAADADDLLARLMRHWQLDELTATPAVTAGVPPAIDSEIRRMMAADQLGWLPEGILVKVDRAAMAVSLETRVPMLDAGVVALSWRLPPALLLSGAGGKPVLRRILARHVPAALTDRPKQGFDPPVAGWLRGPLRDWAGDLLSAATLARTGAPVSASAVQRRLAAHLSGRADHARPLWTLLMLQAWWLHRSGPGGS